MVKFALGFGLCLFSLTGACGRETLLVDPAPPEDGTDVGGSEVVGGSAPSAPQNMSSGATGTSMTGQGNSPTPPPPAVLPPMTSPSTPPPAMPMPLPAPVRPIAVDAGAANPGPAMPIPMPPIRVDAGFPQPGTMPPMMMACATPVPCLTTLFAACTPTGACRQQAGGGSSNVCYDNGVKMVTVGSSTRVNTASGALCYTVETMGGGRGMQTYSFRDAMDNVVATGATANMGQVMVACTGQAAQSVSMNCLNLPPGVGGGGGRPGGGVCAQGVCN